MLGGVGRVEQGADACVSGLRTIDEAARPVGDLPLGAAPVLPAHLPMAAGRKVAELKKATLVLIERDGRLVGVVDQTALLAAADDEQLGDAMKRLEVCLAPTTPLARARELFARTGATALPVAAGALLLGVVERSAVERALRQVEWRDVGSARVAARRPHATDGCLEQLVPRRNAA